MTSKYETIQFTAELYWPCIYVPTTMTGIEGRETYGFSVDAATVPQELASFVPFKGPRTRTESCSFLHERFVHSFASFRQKWKPAVILREGNRHPAVEVAQIRQFMEVANLQPDQLFDAIKADILVQPYEFMDPGNGRPHKAYGAQVLAIRVSYTDMLAQYDLATERFFK